MSNQQSALVLRWPAAQCEPWWWWWWWWCSRTYLWERKKWEIWLAYTWISGLCGIPLKRVKVVGGVFTDSQSAQRHTPLTRGARGRSSLPAHSPHRSSSSKAKRMHWCPWCCTSSRNKRGIGFRPVLKRRIFGRMTINTSDWTSACLLARASQKNKNTEQEGEKSDCVMTLWAEGK